MRKIITVFILTALLIALAIPKGHVEAAGEAEFSLSPASGHAGDTVTVKINISDNPGISGLKIKIGYDGSRLTLISAENSGILSGFMYTGSQTIDVNPYVMVWANAGNTNENGEIGTLTFKINDAAAPGDADLDLVCDFCTNQDLENVDFDVTGGSITITGENGETGTSLWPLWFLLLIPVAGAVVFVVYRSKAAQNKKEK